MSNTFDIGHLRLVHITLPGEFYPEVRDKKVVIVTQPIDSYTILLKITPDPLDEANKVIDLNIKFITDEITGGLGTMPLIGEEIERAAKRLFDV